MVSQLIFYGNTFPLLTSCCVRCTVPIARHARDAHSSKGLLAATSASMENADDCEETWLLGNVDLRL